ncbi:hypothetical protein OSB04_000049 [Centaurea solstitialis]|uniref:BZIP domain-containing protein n=1 Tax=Centaurea solstitialis TaxID=347529 RepID=A0AA38U7T1_9ASTR|nr:hypothetical protein OSB04_000049 [Centaurea solstitialis]
MQAGELNDSPYLLQANQTLNNSPILQFNVNVNTPVNQVYHLDINPQFQEILRSNSTSDEADVEQLSLINERKQRRMISNRESARRSRMRKQKHLDELWSQVMWLRNENHQLVDKLNKFSETHEQVLQENVQLKEEASELRTMVAKLQLNGTYSTLEDLDDIHSHTAYFRTESSNPSISSSSDFF